MLRARGFFFFGEGFIARGFGLWPAPKEQAGYAENMKDKNNSATGNVRSSLTVRISFVLCLQIVAK